jgi:hypothetical protein
MLFNQHFLQKTDYDHGIQFYGEKFALVSLIPDPDADLKPRVPDPDPIKSFGSLRIRIHNTDLEVTHTHTKTSYDIVISYTQQLR